MKDEIPGWNRGDTLTNAEAVKLIMEVEGIRNDTALVEGRISMLRQYGYLTASLNERTGEWSYTRSLVDPDLAPKPKKDPVEQWVPEHFENRVITVADVNGIHHTIEVAVRHQESSHTR